MAKACKPGTQRGFSIVSAIFLLVVLTILGVAIVKVSTTQSASATQDVLGSRAYRAARSGAEWGAFQVLDPANTTVVAPNSTLPAWPNLPACPATTAMAIEGFGVAVDCQSWDANELGLTRWIRIYQITSTASFGVIGAANAIERQVVITVSKCRDTNGYLPDFRCD